MQIMRISGFSMPIRQILAGNAALVICCVFYLIWWLIAFKPGYGVRDMKTGWLLIPASAAGLIGVFLIISGIMAAHASHSLISGLWILIGGVAVYFILLAVTSVFFHRQVTTELALITGYCMLALSEINTLYGVNLFSSVTGVLLMITVIVATVISMICYMMYYGLSETAGYIDGTLPLVITCFITVLITLFMIL